MDVRSTPGTSVLSFGVFELDPTTGELRKNGVLVKLPPQPFKILGLLASRRGALVTREEVQREIWGAETFVDFEQGMNHCIKQIRTALGDNADSPRYIETVPRRGYRFIAPVEVRTPTSGPAAEAHADTAAPSLPLAPVQPNRGGLRAFQPRFMLVGSAALLGIAAMFFWLTRSSSRFMPTENDLSIAVLSFVDMSAEKNQEYFSDGLAEELLDALAKTPGLRVIGRTSSFQFKGKNEDLRSIGKKLNVATILEGSVRKQGNRVRIAVQLIKTADGFHLWSDVYDRDMDDIFATQEAIAHAVTNALKLKLLAQRTAASSVTHTNVEAYNSYLQGHYFLEHRTAENLSKAVAYLQEATKLDPGYAPAWVDLGECYRTQAGSDYIPAEQGYPKARDAAQKALMLDPNLAEAHSLLGMIQLFQNLDWAAADASVRRAFALAPGNADVIRSAATLAKAQGHLDEAIGLYRRAIQLDPLHSNAYKNLGIILHYAGREQDAMVNFRKALEFNSEMAFVHSFVSESYLAQSRPADALAEAQKENFMAYRSRALALAYFALGNAKESDASLAELVSKFHANARYQIAEVYAFRGDSDRAFDWLDRAYAQRDSGLSDIKVDWLLKNVKHDPRYTVLLKNMHLPL